MYNIKVLWIFILIVTLDVCCSTRRELHAWVNRGCGRLCEEKNVTMVYLKAEGPNDTLHYLWDFIGNPSILLAVTPPSVDLNIDWPSYIHGKKKSINFTAEPLYTFGIIIKKIYEFDDIDDTGLIDTVPNKNINVLHSKSFHWKRKFMQKTRQLVELGIESTGYSNEAQNITRNGTLQFVLNGFCSLNHSDITPHLLHSENSTQIDIIIDHFQTNTTFSRSRFAIELIIVSEGKSNTTMSLDTKKSLDDEHTPGIFELVEIRTPVYSNGNETQNAAGYLQWRPVSYTDAFRDVTSSTEMIHYPLIRSLNHTNEATNSLLYSFYGERIEHLLVQKFNVSLGSKGDGFYKKSNYLTWTFIIGYGVPPDEQFSYLVILIISIGIGLPALMMLCASSYFCIRRLRKHDASVMLDR